MIDTTTQNAQLFFDVDTFDGMTAACLYGGLLLTNVYKFRTDFLKKHQYRHETKSKIYRNKTMPLGLYCTHGIEGVPLIGAINNIYLTRGTTYLILYALPPFFKISLTMRVVPTECEGVANVMVNHCVFWDEIRRVMTPTYIVYCGDRKDTAMVLMNDVCVVIQHVPPIVDDIDLNFRILSPVALVTKLKLVHGNMIPFVLGRTICLDRLEIIQRNSRDEIKAFSSAIGAHIGIPDKDGDIKVQKHSYIIDIKLSLIYPCWRLPQLYFQFQISNLESGNECHISECGVPDYGTKDVHELQTLIGQCAIIIMKTFKGFYSFAMVHGAAYGLKPTREDYHFFIIAQPSCITHAHIYLMRYLNITHIAHYRIPGSRDRLIFSLHDFKCYFSFDISQNRNCKIWVAFETGPSTGQHYNCSNDIRSPDFVVCYFKWHGMHINCKFSR